MGARDAYGYYGSSYAPYGQAPQTYRLSSPLQDTVLPLMCATGRCMLRLGLPARILDPLAWDDGPPWQLWLAVQRGPRGGYLVSAALRRENERLALSAPLMLVAGGFVFTADRVARLADGGLFPWISLWRTSGDLSIPAGKAQEWLGEVLSLPAVPRLEVPPDLAYEETAVVPRPRLLVRAAKTHYDEKRLGCHLSFDYDGAIIPAIQPGRGVFQPDRRRLVLRDPVAERTHAERLPRLGIRRPPEYVASAIGARLVIAPGRLSRAVGTLLAEGWHVEAEGKLYRSAGGFHLESARASTGSSCAAASTSTGTSSRCPSCWPRCAAARIPCGSTTAPSACCPRSGCGGGAAGRVRPGRGDDLRFSRAQVGLLDALLAAQPEATCDEAFARAREELRRFEGIQPAEAPADFAGTLRPYQREGLGWLHFLARFGFGGCLADDMGLGKTVQVLALLEARRERRAESARAARRARRWSWCRARWSSTGSRRRRASPRTCGSSITPAPAGARRGEQLRRLRPGPHHLRHAAARCRGASRNSASTT